MTTPGLFDDAEIISSYTRAQAVEDGQIKDVSSLSSRMGFKIPVGIAVGAYAETVKWGKTEQTRHRGSGQSEEGRLRDVLMLANHAIVRNRHTDRATFTVRCVMPGPGRTRSADVELQVYLTDDGTGKPAITICTPEEA